MATDWREAGRRSDATRVLRLYRRAFDNDAKRLARTRAIEALKASGARTVVVLWGGGLDAEELVAAGFQVIAVDNGSMTITADGREVSTIRKRRALQYAAEAGGYQWRWGDVDKYLCEGDGALLDFHGPWSKAGRRAIQAARHMTAVVVTLTPSHDVSADATSASERQMAYQLFLKMSWADKPRWEAMTANGHVRRLTDYHEDQGRHVFVYLLGRKHVQLSVMPVNQRAKMRRDVAERVNARGRDWYRKQPPDVRKRLNDRSRHNAHLRSGRLPLFPCPICSATREPELCARDACSTAVPPERVRGPKFYCSPRCQQLVKLDAQRMRASRLAAVSGTTTEAISNEVAA